MSFRIEEEISKAESALKTLPDEQRKAVIELGVWSTMNVPSDQREFVKARLVNAIIAALPYAQRELKFNLEDLIKPTKMISGKYTIVDLRPELFNLTTFRKYWTSTGEQDCAWNVSSTSEKVYIVIIGFQNPEPSPKTRYVYGKIGVDDLPVLYVGDLSSYRVKVLPQPFGIKPKTSIELKQYIEATGYDEFRPFGAAFVPSVEATKVATTTFY